MLLINFSPAAKQVCAVGDEAAKKIHTNAKIDLPQRATFLL